MKKRGKFWLDLPDEIIISSGLDLKSIIKCMLVCKEWRKLISNNPNLGAKGHIQFLGYDFDLHRFGTLDDDTHDIVWMKTLHSPLRIKYLWRTRFQVGMSSCNGLVCLLSTHHEDVLICNPITGEHISLVPNTWSDFRIFNLGFCPSTNEYKLTIFRFSFLEVLTLGNPNSGWRTVPFQPPFLEFAGLHNPVICVDGVLHWLLKPHCILTFDLADEVVGSVPLPRLEAGKEIYQMGCVDSCLVVTAGLVNPFSGMEIWTRKEDKSSGEPGWSWTKNWIIDDAPLLVRFTRLVPRKLSTDGRIIMTYKEYGSTVYSLYSYDPREKRVRPLHSPTELRCFDYTPTLVSPKKLWKETDKKGRGLRENKESS